MEQVLDPRAKYADAESSRAAGKSAVSWPAILAGALVAASVSLILFALGSGLGFAAASPWPGRGASATTFAVTTAIWLIVMQWMSAGIGGYIAGRLRTKWVGTHTHEVFFRDTAHGFITWSVATVLVAAVFATSVFSATSDAAYVAATAHAGTPPLAGTPMNAAGNAGGAANAYDVDKLFRSARSGDNVPAANAAKIEANHIIENDAATGSVPDADRSYLVGLVATHTGVPQVDAQKRVDDFIASAMAAETKIKAAADAARKAAAQAAIYTALSMLVGAFIASVAGALGGRLRDEHI
jgi:hypothetical protein